MNAQESIYYIGNHRGLAIGKQVNFYLIHLLPVLGCVACASLRGHRRYVKACMK